MTRPVLRARFTATALSRGGHFPLEIDLVHTGGVLVLYGPSGAGKTLTLRALAGLLRPTDGRIALNGRVLFDAAASIDLPPHRRRIAWVPQGDTLFPHLAVRSNVEFARAADPHSAELLMERLGVARHAAARPTTLSGGERRRVALARALARGGELLLLDEPTAGLDDAARLALIHELDEILRRRRLPTILVTHRRDEAMALGQRVVRIDGGRTVGTGLPEDLVVRGDRASG